MPSIPLDTTDIYKISEKLKPLYCQVYPPTQPTSIKLVKNGERERGGNREREKERRRSKYNNKYIT